MLVEQELLVTADNIRATLESVGKDAD
jgi:hypothetical protein